MTTPNRFETVKLQLRKKFAKKVKWKVIYKLVLIDVNWRSICVFIKSTYGKGTPLSIYPQLGET